MKRNVVVFLVLLLPGALAAGEEIPEASIRTAVEELASPDYATRQAAYARFLDWGAVSPDRILAALPEGEQDEDLAATCARLRKRLPTEGMRRKLLALVAGAPPGALNGNRSAATAADLVNAFFDDPEPTTTLTFSRIFAVPPAEAADALWMFRKAADPATRAAVMSAFEYVDSARARRLAEENIADADLSVRMQAVPLFARLAGKEALAPLAALLGDPKREMRLAAVQAIAGIGPDAGPVLRRFVEGQFADQQSVDRVAVSHALCGIVRAKDPESASLLASLTDQFDLVIRSTAIQGLGELENRRFAVHIARHLDDPEAFIRNAAARGLAAVSGDAALKKACADQLTLTLEDQIFFFMSKEEDLQLGGGAEGIRPDEAAIAAARAWWEARRDDPAFRPERK